MPEGGRGDRGVTGARASPGTGAGSSGWDPGMTCPAGGPGPRPHPAAPGAAVVARAGGSGAVQTRRPGRRRPGWQQAARAGVPHRGRTRAGLRQPGDRGRAPVELDDAGRPGLPALRDRSPHRVLRQWRRRTTGQHAAAPLARGGRAVHRGGGTVVSGRGHRGGHRRSCGPRAGTRTRCPGVARRRWARWATSGPAWNWPPSWPGWTSRRPGCGWPPGPAGPRPGWWPGRP